MICPSCEVAIIRRYLEASTNGRQARLPSAPEMEPRSSAEVFQAEGFLAEQLVSTFVHLNWRQCPGCGIVVMVA